MVEVKNSGSSKNVKPAVLSAFFCALLLQEVNLSPVNHNRRVEHGEKECNNGAINHKEKKRRKNGRRSSSERDNSNVQNGDNVLCGRERNNVTSISGRIDEEGIYRNHIRVSGSSGGDGYV